MSGRLVTLAEPRLQARIDAPNLDAIALIEEFLVSA
jgi:hypothetical protein